LGADYTVLIDSSMDASGFAKKVVETLGSAPEKAIECSGADAGVKLAILVC